MMEYKYANLFFEDSVDKQFTIEIENGGVITNVELFSESIELNESLCSESELRFGCCEASVLKFKVANIVSPLAKKWLTVNMTLNHNADVPLKLGQYKVFSDKPTADKRYREIVAYDAMYDIINADVAAWYNKILPSADSTVTMKEFRTSFIAYFGLEQEDIELANDKMLVERTIEPAELSGKDVITAICEINGCFGHIGRDGKFHYITLKKNARSVYPKDDLYPSDDLYPMDSSTVRITKTMYLSCKYEDYVTSPIKKLQIRQEENDIGAIIGTEGNSYIVQDNFLVYGKSADELSAIAENLLGVITGIIYRPFEAEVKGNPCIEVGDGISIGTKFEIVESYVLKRTLKGIQALRDSYEADGAEYYTEKVNSVQKSIIQLKAKTNTLVRTIEETRLTIADLESGLHSEITQTASQIRSEVSNATTGLQSQIEQTASQIRLEVSNVENGLKASIQLSESGIRTDVGALEGALRSTISQTDSQIRADVQSVASNLHSQIIMNAENINLRVQKGSIISEINQTAEAVTISASRIDLNGLVNATEFTSKFATINTLRADYMEVANWTSSGYIRADKISADTINSKLAELLYVTTNGIHASGEVRCTGLRVTGDGSDMYIPMTATWKTITVSGTSYKVLCES